MRNLILQTIKSLCSKAGTRDPFTIAEYLHIIVLQENLGSIRGYYNVVSRQKFIHINENLSDEEQRFTCAHELGHALLHPKANTPFLRENTLFSVDKLERQANLFAAYLLCSDELLRETEHCDYTIKQISIISGVPEEILKRRL